MTRFAALLGRTSLCRAFACVAFIATGCGSSARMTATVDGGGTSDDSGVTSGPTYYQDVAPLLAAKCTMCHRTADIAPFRLDTADAAVAYAGLMKTATATRTMPPWPPGPLSPQMLHSRGLTDAQVALFAAWADRGAPLGDAAHPAPLGTPDIVDIGTADLAADTGVDYVPDSSLTDDYRCFLVPLGVTEDHVVTGYRITPGNRKTVHHVITSLFASTDRAALEAIDNETPDRAGWPCVGGAVPLDSTLRVDGSLGAWVPGVSSVLLPAGTGTAIHAGDLAVMQIHYNLLGGTDPDRTRIELKFAPKGTESSLRQLTALRLIRRDLNLPANQSDIVQENSFAARVWAGGKFYADGDAYVMMVAGHMHTLGTHIAIERRNAQGVTTLLDIPAWDFHWQGSYLLAQPLVIHADDQLAVRCTYDNTAEQREANGWAPGAVTDVHWGEGTHDEMCLASVVVVDQAPTP